MVAVPRYYLTGSGAMAQAGWRLRQRLLYYLDAVTGAMATGWFQDGTAWYYSSSSGA